MSRLTCHSALQELFPALEELFSGFTLLLLATFAVAAIGLVTLFYWQAFSTLRVRQWLTLYGLRVAAIAIVFLLLLQPVLTVQREVTQRKAVVFVVDNSASMGIADNPEGGTRWQQTRDQVSVLWSELEDDYDLQLVLFSDAAQRLESPDALAPVEAVGKATSLSRGLMAARRAAAGRPVEALVLISDGIQNAAGDPISTARRMGLNIMAIGVGDPLHDRSLRRDIRVTDMECPEQIAVKNKTRVTGYVDAVGMPGHVVQVRLLEDGEPVCDREVTLNDVEGAQEVVFEFIPERKGLRTYTVEVPQRPDERIPQNNRRSSSALVHDARIRVLYLEGTLRAEYGALVGQFLSKDPNVEYCALIQTRPNVFVQRTNIDGLDLKGIPDSRDVIDSFDVFLIGDLSATFLPPAKAELIRDRVQAGAGLIMIGGYHSLGPGGYTGSAIEQLLPVELGGPEVGQVTELFQPRMTPQGRRHPIFANISDFFAAEGDNSLAQTLPPLGGCVKVAGAKPSAELLLVHPDVTAAGSPMAVMAVHRFGEGRSAVFTADTTRNWHQALRAMDQETPFLRFWGQTVRWLAGRGDTMEAEAGIVSTTDKAYYAPEATVTISATVRAEDGSAAAGAGVTATVKDPEGTVARLALRPKPGPAGNYAGTFQPALSGRYEIAVAATVGTAQLTAETLQIDVGRPSLEFDRLDLDEATLTAIANDTGGQYLHVSLADRLVKSLRDRHEKQRVEREVPLAWPPLLWLLFLGALTSEWWLRRRYQLR
ncbi:MAG: VWA domain-containing protein [Planctomycetes bacterium]|nr:VWA domain-containing protein [Planctomycetota bacterium]